MALFQSPGGAVSSSSLIGAVPRRSTLTGSVKRGRGGTGRTTLPPITGAGGVHIKLKGRPFAVTRAALVKGGGSPSRGGPGIGKNLAPPEAIRCLIGISPFSDDNAGWVSPRMPRDRPSDP